MSVAFYLDEQVPSAIADGLRAREVDVLTAQDDGLDSEDDLPLLLRAMELNRIMFTMDADFLAIAESRQRDDLPFSGVVYVSQLKLSYGQVIDDLEYIAKVAEPEDIG